MIVDEYGSLTNSTDVTNLLVYDFNISMETTDGYASRINGKNEIHNRSIHNMFIIGLLYSNQHENRWCCEEETSEDVYRCKIYIALYNASPQFS